MTTPNPDLAVTTESEPKLPSDFAQRFPIKDTPMYADLVMHHTARIDAEERAWRAETALSLAKQRIGRLEQEIQALRERA